MRKQTKLRLLQRKLDKKSDFYGTALEQRMELLNRVKEFSPTTLSEFAAGYTAALSNVRRYGLERVEANALSGIPK